MRKIEFEKRWEAKHPLYRLEAVLRGYTAYAQVHACEPKYGLMSIHDSVATTYYEKSELKDAFRVGLDIISSHSKVSSYVEDAEDHCRRFVELSKHISSIDLSKLSKKELSNITNSFLDLFAGLFAYYNLSRPDYLAGIDKLIREEVHDQEIFALITASEEMNTYTRHELAILKSAEKILAGKESIDVVSRQLAEDFGWISTQEDNPPLSSAHYKDKMSALLKEGKLYIEEKIKEIINKPEETRKKKKDAIESYNISKKIQELADSVACLGHLRLQVRFWWTEGSFHAKALFVELNKRLGFADKRIGGFYCSEYLLRDEYERAIEGKEIIHLDTVEDRAKRSVLLMLEKKINLYVGDKADAIDQQYIVEEDFSSITEIHGSIANKGIARGRAWVISPSVKSQSEKASQMKEGDILVAAMTRPQFISAISKASAIITDEGGITCHAAIISREMNKPCIIGTKIATKVLKDGDMVEVDAEKGVVRILK